MEKELRESILSLSRIFNIFGIKRFREDSIKEHLDASTIHFLEREKVIRYWGDRTFAPDFEKYSKFLLKMMDVNDDLLRPCCKGLNYYCADIKPSDNPISIRIFLVNSISSNFIDCLVGDHSTFIIPFILAPAIEINKIGESRESHVIRLKRKLFLKILNTLNVLSLFVVPLPFPDSNKTLKTYVNVLRSLERDIRELRKLVYANEYDMLVNFNRIMLVKALSPFKFLYKNLKEYSITELRGTREFGVRPDKWFEEVLKALIVKFYVETSFPGEITDFLYREYSTGGPCEEDIAVPITIDNKIYIVIVDAKLWAKDACTTIIRDTQHIIENASLVQNYRCRQDNWEQPNRPKESLIKYLLYINSKSKKLMKLEKMLARRASSISGYYLLFVQLKEPQEQCIDKLNELQKRIKLFKNNLTLYNKIQIISIDELIKHLQRNAFPRIFLGNHESVLG